MTAASGHAHALWAPRHPSRGFSDTLGDQLVSGVRTWLLRSVARVRTRTKPSLFVQKSRSPGKETRVHPVPNRIVDRPTGPPAHRPDASEHPLVGAWLLSTVAIVDVSGRTLEHPLGQRPTGLITSTADGHMSVSMLRVPRRWRYRKARTSQQPNR
ncbi:lipocalin-like domain-containing protein [Streptomyces sp. NBC_00057]|uniref:lipocalin-like domain-containing protein n=1 Tax=Streptomyces sp. NBC_00057 TaxID=2975634 RepID=UPI00386798AD